MKKLIAIVLSVLMVLSFAACGQTSDETTAPETNAPETQAPETEAPTNAPETEAPETETEAEKSGCGSAIGMTAAVMAFAAAAAVVLKKKD